MKKVFIICMILSLLLLLIGCSGQEVADQEEEDVQVPAEPSEPEEEPVACAQDAKQCPDGSFVSRDPDNNCEFPSCPIIDLPSEEIVEIQNNLKIPNSYSYVDGKSGSKVYVKGDIIKVELQDLEKYKDSGWRFETVFLDTTAKDAYAYCLDTFRCKNDLEKYAKVRYTDYLPLDPYTHVTSLTNGEVVGTQQCESRRCDVIQYTQDDTTYKMYIRQIYYLPSKITELDEEGRETSIYSYTDAAFNHLKNDDVQQPEEFELVEG